MKEGYIGRVLNEDWEAINLADTPSFREKTEEERQLEYFHEGEAIDLDYMLDMNPSLKHYFGALIDSGAVRQIDFEENGWMRHFVQYNEDPDIGEPRMDPWDAKEWKENDQ